MSLSRLLFVTEWFVLSFFTGQFFFSFSSSQTFQVSIVEQEIIQTRNYVIFCYLWQRITIFCPFSVRGRIFLINMSNRLIPVAINNNKAFLQDFKNGAWHFMEVVWFVCLCAIDMYPGTYMKKSEEHSSLMATWTLGNCPNTNTTWFLISRSHKDRTVFSRMS